MRTVAHASFTTAVTVNSQGACGATPILSTRHAGEAPYSWHLAADAGGSSLDFSAPVNGHVQPPLSGNTDSHADLLHDHEHIPSNLPSPRPWMEITYIAGLMYAVLIHLGRIESRPQPPSTAGNESSSGGGGEDRRRLGTAGAPLVRSIVCRPGVVDGQSNLPAVGPSSTIGRLSGVDVAPRPILLLRTTA
nr:unnamed protein product [Digitaria exilis]